MGITVNIPTEVGQEINGETTNKAPSEAVVKAALDEKLNINQLPANIILYPTDAEADLAGFFRMVSSVEDPDYNTAAVDISTGAITGADQLLAELVADANLFVGNPGVINLATIGNVKKVSGGANTFAEFYFKVFQRDELGAETLVGTSGKTPQVEGLTYEQFSAVAMVNNGTFVATDRIVIRYYGTKIGGGSSPVYNFQFGGSDPVRTTLPIPASLLVNLPIHIGETEVIDGTNGKLLAITGGKVGEVTADKNLVGLGNVDNTSDADKPVSTATQTALNGKSNTGHAHTIADVTGLQTALDGKASAVHSHVISDVTGLQTALDGKQSTLVSGTNIKTVGGVSLLGSGNIEIDTGLYAVGNISTNVSPEGVIYIQGATAAEDQIWIVNTGSNNVTVYSCETLQLLATITVGTSPDWLVYDPNNAKVYVTNGGATSVTVINKNSFSVVTTITTPATARGIGYAGNNKVAIGLANGTARFINTLTDTLTANVLSVLGGQVPVKFVLNNTNGNLYFSTAQTVFGIIDPVNETFISNVVASSVIGKFDIDQTTGKLYFNSNTSNIPKIAVYDSSLIHVLTINKMGFVPGVAGQNDADIVINNRISYSGVSNNTASWVYPICFFETTNDRIYKTFLGMQGNSWGVAYDTRRNRLIVTYRNLSNALVIKV